MVLYPLRIPRHPYRGSHPPTRRKADRFNAVAEKLERYINSEFEKSHEQTRVFIYGFVARELGWDTAEVADVLFGVDAGSNGITITRGLGD
jgi:hypothetical protein